MNGFVETNGILSCSDGLRLLAAVAEEVPAPTSSETNEDENVPCTDDGNRHYNWSFTYSNYPTDVDDRFGVLFHGGSHGDPAIRYICYGYEIAPTTGTPHLQGLICFKSNVRWSTVDKVFRKLCNGDGHIHFGWSRLSAYANYLYCMKLRKVDPISNEKTVEFGQVLNILNN